MTDKYIIQLINKLNRNSNYKDCIKVGIGKNVELAHVWDNEPFSDSHVPYTYFLIKEEEKYIGAVLDMTQDLHWVILPKHRKNGHLSKALKHIILPYLFEETSRSVQKISIKKNEIGEQNYQNSLKVALSVGFKQIDEENFVLDYNSLDEEEYQLDFQYKGLSEEEFNNCINQLQKLAKQINVIGSKIELGYGKSTEEYSGKSIFERADNIANLKYILNDIKQDFEI